MSRNVKVMAEESLDDFLEYEVVDLDYRGIRLMVWGNPDDSVTVRIENPNTAEGADRALMLHRSRAAMEATLTQVLDAIRKVKAREPEPEYVNWTAPPSSGGQHVAPSPDQTHQHAGPAPPSTTD